MYDVILKGGSIVDGTGGRARAGDLAISKGRIVRIAERIEDAGAEVVDVSGLVVAPGFIDIHSHSDDSFLKEGSTQSKIYQGVTTEVAGQCGHTPFPNQGAEPGSADDGKDGSFTAPSLEAFLGRVARENRKMSTNLILLIGHGSVRNAAMGSENRRPTAAELERMKAMVDADIRTGAWGLSLGLGYAPGVSSEQDELNELGSVVAKYDGIVTSHMRNQGAGTPESLEEMFNIYRYSGVKVHIAHYKVSGKANWGRAPEFVEWIHEAKRNGIKVSVDVYPYRASSSGITNCWPNWAIQGGRERAVERTYNDERPLLLEALGKRFATPEDGDSLYVVTTYGKFPIADGKTIGEIAHTLGVSMAEAVLEVTRQTGARATCVSFSMCEDDVRTMLAQNDFAIGSDGRGFSLDPRECDGKPHPRNFGTFPRFLRIARENRLCPLETAVYRMTGLAKEIMGIPDRGILAEGNVADITVFDPQTVADTATFDDPIRRNVGIRHVLIDGKFAFRDGEQTSLRLGKFLLKK
jgi:N-acyl-D-amino-acid deacylase